MEKKSDEQENEEAKEQMRELEEGDPPEKLEDWPEGRAKNLNYGRPGPGRGYDGGAGAVRRRGVPHPRGFKGRADPWRAPRRRQGRLASSHSAAELGLGAIR